jgi:hypothetical protein
MLLHASREGLLLSSLLELFLSMLQILNVS